MAPHIAQYTAQEKGRCTHSLLHRNPPLVPQTCTYGLHVRVQHCSSQVGQQLDTERHPALTMQPGHPHKDGA